MIMIRDFIVRKSGSFIVKYSNDKFIESMNNSVYINLNNGDKVSFKYQGGLLSGWRSTSMIGSICNIVFVNLTMKNIHC